MPNDYLKVDERSKSYEAMETIDESVIKYLRRSATAGAGGRLTIDREIQIGEKFKVRIVAAHVDGTTVVHQTGRYNLPNQDLDNKVLYLMTEVVSASDLAVRQVQAKIIECYKAE